VDEEAPVPPSQISAPSEDEKKSSVGFSSLPEDVCMKFSSWLTFRDVCNLAACSRHWYQICKQERVWKAQYRIRWESDVNVLGFGNDSIVDFYTQFKERVRIDLNWSQGKSKVISLTGHNGSVTALQYNRQNLFTASDDGGIIKWTMSPPRSHRIDRLDEPGLLMQQHHRSSKSGVPQQCGQFHGHAGPIWCLNFFGNLLASGGYDKCVKIWNCMTGNCLLTLRGHEQWVSSVALHGLMVLSGSWDASLRIWRIGTCLKNAESVSVLRGDPENAIHCVKWHPSNQNHVAAACRQRTIQLWDIEAGEVVTSFLGHMKEVQCLQFEENTILSGGGDHCIKLWDQRTGGCVHTFRGHTGSVMCLQHDSTKIIGGGYDKTLRIFDIRQRKVLHSLFGHSSAVFSLQFDQNQIVSGSADTRAIIWQFR